MLSNKDIRLLRELDVNSRRSLSSVAENLRMSKENVNYAIKKLEKSKIISGYFSMVNYFKLGFKIFKLLVSFKDLGEKGEAKIIEWLGRREEVVWMGKVTGKWDIIISIREKDIEKIYSFLEDFNKTFSIHVKERQLLSSYEIEWLNEKYLYEDKSKSYQAKFNQKDDKIKLDEKDEKIVGFLEHNARIPLIEISSKVKLTAEAVSKRIQNLVKNAF